MQAHKTFQVSRSTIDDWLRLREQTGSVQVAARQRRAEPGLRSAEPGLRSLAGQAGFAAFVQGHQHSTLEQMRQAWQQQTHQSLSTMSFSRALRQQGYTRKKRVVSTGSGAPQRESSSRSR